MTTSRKAFSGWAWVQGLTSQRLRPRRRQQRTAIQTEALESRIVLSAVLGSAVSPTVPDGSVAVDYGDAAVKDSLAQAQRNANDGIQAKFNDFPVQDIGGSGTLSNIGNLTYDRSGSMQFGGDAPTSDPYLAEDQAGFVAAHGDDGAAWADITDALIVSGASGHHDGVTAFEVDHVGDPDSLTAPASEADAAFAEAST